MIEDSLSRIFDGREAMPEGDRRPLKLTPAEYAAANNAGRVFNTGQFRLGYGYPEADIYDPRFPGPANAKKSRLREVISKYGQKETLSPEDRKEIGSALMPFLRHQAISAQLQSGLFVIPPQTKCRYNFDSICMDKNWPAPRSGEKMQLVPIETLLPDRLADVYKNVIRRSSQGDINPGDVQGLTWTLRQVAQDADGKKPVTISERHRWILNNSMPNGYAVFEAVRRPLGRSSLPKELEKLVRDEVNQAVGRQDNDGLYATRTISDEQMSQAVDEQMARLRAMPVTDPIPDNNSHYNQLAPGVYARASYGSVDIQIANDSTDFYLFKPEDYAGQSERQTQRMGLFWEPTTPPSQQPITHLPLVETMPDNSPVDRIIYVNGINTCWDKALCTAKVLHHKLKVPITLAYNENLFRGYDQLNALAEICGGEETLTVFEWDYTGTMPVSTPAYRQELYTTAYSRNNIFTNLICEVINSLTKGERLGLLGHSEGTTIINEAVAAIIKARKNEIVLFDQNGNQISTTTLNSIDLRNIHIVLAGGQEASDRFLNTVGSIWQIIHHKDKIPQISCSPDTTIGPEVFNPNEDVPEWAFRGIYRWVLPEEVLEYEENRGSWFILKYHDFLLVYLPNITLASFARTVKPLELTQEPPDDVKSPCPPCPLW